MPIVAISASFVAGAVVGAILLAAHLERLAGQRGVDDCEALDRNGEGR